MAIRNGPAVHFSCNIVSNFTNATVDVGTSEWLRVYARMPTFSTGTAVQVYGAIASGTGAGTYYPLAHLCPAAASGITMSWCKIEMTTAMSGYYQEIPPGWQYYKFVVTSTISNNTDVNVYCIPF